MLTLERDLYDRVRELLTPQMTEQEERRELLSPALSVYPSLHLDIDWTGSAHDFTNGLMQKCLTFGEVTEGKQALELVLETVRDEVGVDQQAQIDALIDEITLLAVSERAKPEPPDDPSAGRTLDDPLAERNRWYVVGGALILLLLGALLFILLRNVGVFSTSEKVTTGSYKLTYPKTIGAGQSAVVTVVIGLPDSVASIEVSVSRSRAFEPSIKRLSDSELVRPSVLKYDADSDPIDISQNMRAQLDGFDKRSSDPDAWTGDLEPLEQPARHQWNVVAPTTVGLHVFTIRVYRGDETNPWVKSYEYQVVDFATGFTLTNSATQVREGPTGASPLVAELPAGTEVQPVGRSDNGTWVAVAFGEEFESIGWVQADKIDVTNVADLPIIAAPTSTPVTPATITPSPTATPQGTSPTPSATPSPYPATETSAPTTTLTPVPTSDSRVTPTATATSRVTPTASPTPPVRILPETGVDKRVESILHPILVAAVGLIVLSLGMLVCRFRSNSAGR